jgi:succinate-semialdehyde dehydrogenase/glutarate-semialdehyde dehydrogenase
MRKFFKGEKVGIKLGPVDLLIDGVWTKTSQRFPVSNPADNSVITEVADATVQDAIASVDSSHEAFKTFSQTSPRSRAEILRKAFEIMTSEIDYCAELISLENGKALKDAKAESVYAAEFFRWFSEEASRITGDFRYAPNRDKTIITDHKPIGVAALITPWNFPAAMATRKIGPAIAAGCTMILKPASETPLTALWIADVMQRAGAPKGVVNVLTTSKSSEIISTIMKDERVKTVSFTGSTYVGKILLHQAADSVMHCSMELGGNAPFVVLEGANVDSAVAGAMVAKMRNGGAACTAANRFYIHESVSKEFSQKFGAALAALKVGPGVNQDTDLGAMVSIKERDKIVELIEKAKAEGANVISTTKVPDSGAFLSPHVVTGVKHGSVLTREEIFGPVAPIVEFQKQSDAIEMANDTEYGLISYVYAKDGAEGIKVARQMDTGMVAINRGVASDPAAPFGGMKESGLGREGGFAGIHEFLEPQYFAIDL